MTKVKEIVERLRQDFPEDIASKGDPVGMQIGSIDADVTKVMTTLDVRPQVVEEAVKKGVNFIVSHHPVMFRPARNLDFANAQNAMYGEIIKNGITVYSIHTNSDKAQNGSADWQAEEEVHGRGPRAVQDEVPGHCSSDRRVRGERYGLLCHGVHRWPVAQ